MKCLPKGGEGLNLVVSHFLSTPQTVPLSAVCATEAAFFLKGVERRLLLFPTASKQMKAITERYKKLGGLPGVQHGQSPTPTKMAEMHGTAL
jgi:hypothetical protein